MSETLTGRELDAAIGERVMGWKHVWVRGWSTGSFIGGHYDSPEECRQACEACHDPELHPVMLWSHEPGWTNGKGEEWSPSTTWEGAGLVVEKMQARGMILHLRSMIHFSWAVFERAGVDPDWPSRGAAQAAPEAICRAALKTKGQGDE